MATCAISTLIQQACANDFVTAANDVQLYRAIKHQLLCNISANGGGGGGALTPFTVQDFVSPALPYSFTATQRTHVEVGYELNAGATDQPSLTFQKTGATNKIISIFPGFTFVTKGIASLILGPGDTLTITNTSVGGIASISSITLYIG